MTARMPLVERREAMLRLTADDPVWIAGVKRGYARWQPRGMPKPGLARCASRADLHDDEARRPRLLLIEVDRTGLRATCDWLVENSRQSNCRIAVLLARRLPLGFESAVDRQLIATLLYEAGASLVLASPRELPAVWDFAAHFFSLAGVEEGDPLDDLPLPRLATGPQWR